MPLKSGNYLFLNQSSYLMELKKVKGHDERRLAEENFSHMTERVNKANPLYQLEIPFEDHYGERERPSFDYNGRGTYIQGSFLKVCCRLLIFDHTE